MKKFEDIISQAFTYNWCVDPHCTTCGSREFKSALLQLNNEVDNGLVKALESIDIQGIVNFPRWSACLQIALNFIKNPDDMDSILSSWLPKLSSNIRLADLVLFHFVKRGCLFAPMSIDMLRNWVDACITLAIQTKDESLIESLIYVEAEDLINHPELIEIIKEKAKYSRLIKRAVLVRNLL